MSRLGKLTVNVPSAVKVAVNKDAVNFEGPKGKLSVAIPAGIGINVDAGKLSVTRSNDDADQRAKHGLVRSLVANSVKGVSEGFERKLEIKGVGFRAAVKGTSLNLTVGFSHLVDFPLPPTVTAKVEGNTTVVLSCPDKGLLGDTAAKVRAVRPPEPYQGKGIRYSDEVIKRKAGKSAASGAK
ncbi:MAG: 50S ribosomal protein L6 [Bdellovibrionota bacterium]